MVRLMALALALAAACGNITRNGPYDAGVAEPPVDAPPDEAQLHEAREFVSGGAKMTSRTYTLDVQVGHFVQQGKLEGPTYRFETNAAVRP
jgi:hypothetical protein